MINKQEIFDLVKTKCLMQNKKCGIEYLENNIEMINPKYHYNGLKCAIGFLIPENEYKSEFEEEESEGCPFSLSVGDYFRSKGYSEEDLEFLTELRYIHDNINIEDWESEFNYIAINYNLNYDYKP